MPCRDTLELTKELQKVRKRHAGVNAIALATGEKISNEQELVLDVRFKNCGKYDRP